MSYINTLAQYRMSEDWAGHLARGSRGGIDYAVGMNTPITAPCDGTLENRPDNGNDFGNYIRFHHGDGFVDEYLHLNSFVGEGNYKQGQVIGYSGTTGNSTGPHVHWHLINPSGQRVNPLDYLNDTPTIPPKKAGNDMYYNRVASNGWQYVVGQEYIRVISAEEVKHVEWNMGKYIEHSKIEDFILWCKALNIPESVIRALSPTNRTWSKLGTLTAGTGGVAPAIDVDAIAKAVDATLKDDFAAIPKTVNDDAAKRLSS